MLNRKILECVKNVNNLTLVSHDNPDVDAILSLNLFSKVLEVYEINHKIVLLTEPDVTTKEIIRRNQLSIFQTYKKEIKKEDNLFCLDCFTLNGYQSQIIGCIDHHPTKLTNHYMVYDNGFYSSTTKRVFDLFIKDNSLFQENLKEFAIQTLYSIYLDTNSLKSSKFNSSDMLWIKETIKKYSLNEEHFIEEGYCFSDLTLPTKELILNGHKTYQLPNHKSAIISYLMLKKISEELINDLLLEIKRYKERESFDYFWMILYDMNMESSVLLKVSDTEINIEKFPYLLSRSLDVYPILEKENLE